ncbi:MAG TPA: hypothetical protein EYH11_03530 [Sulfurimonas autotrophica]|nr:hypothetical protein [Sulfurimonas autotrophica]
MSKFYSISLVEKYGFVVHLEKKKSNLSVLDTQEVAVDTLSSFAKDKKRFIINLFLEFEFSQDIKVPIVIAKSGNVKSYLLYKIKEANSGKNILFNFYKSPKQNDEENIIYRVEAVDENEYLEKLAFVDDFSKIESSTISKFALLSLANRCIDEKCFICVYTIESYISILAVEEKELIFSRTITIDRSNPEASQMNIAENIAQTISYINAQFRDIEFKTLSLSGGVAVDEVIAQHIMMLNSVNISVLYPNTFVKNLNAEESQSHILSLGAALTPKSNQFMPKLILGVQQFNLIATISLFVSIFLLFVMFYFTFDIYEKHQDLLLTNEQLQEQYKKEIAQVKMIPQNEFERYVYNIFMVNKYLETTPVDTLLALEPLISLSKPIQFLYKNEEGVFSFEVKFEKRFNSLKELYQFEREMKRRVEEIKKNMQIEEKSTTDYKQFLYMLELKTKTEKSIKKRVRQL